MSQDLKKLLSDLATALKERVDAGKDDAEKESARTDFLDEVKEGFPEVYQSIATGAAGAARGEEAKRTQRALKRVEAITAENAELKEKLEEAEKSKPDVAKLTEKAEARARKAEEERDALKRDTAQRERDRQLHDAQAQIESALIAMKVRPRVAKGEVAQLVAQGLIKLNDDGEIEIYQPGNPKLTYPSNGQTPVQQLVKEIHKGLDPQDLSSAVQGGGGTARPGGGAPGQTNHTPATSRWKDPVEVTLIDDRTGEKETAVLSPDFLEEKRKAMGMPLR